MEDLPLGRIAALVPEFAVKDLPLGRTHDDDDDDYDTLVVFKLIVFLKFHSRFQKIASNDIRTSLFVKVYTCT